MTKLALAALAAAGIFAIYSAPSFAAFNPVGVPVPGGGGNPGCQVDCGGGGEISTVGDPFIPDFPKDEPKDEPKGDPTEPGDEPTDEPGDTAGNDPNYPGLTKKQIAELKICIANLGGLPTVTETQVNQFGQPYKVSLTPVCDTQFKSAVDVTNALIEGGNVNGLETAIRGNDAMTGKLGQTQYKARDVVGIEFDANGNAILFVHKKRG